jgi:hypothetical protein
MFDVGMSVSLDGLGLCCTGLIPANLKTGRIRDIPAENGITLKRTENLSTVSRPAPATSRPVTGKDHHVFV